MIQTHRTIDLVLNVTQTGTLVVNKLALVILLTDTILNIDFLLPRFVGMDDIVQHQHMLRRLALLRVLLGTHARTNPTHESSFDLFDVERGLVPDGLDQLLGQQVADVPLEKGRADSAVPQLTAKQHLVPRRRLDDGVVEKRHVLPLELTHSHHPT